MGSRLHQSPDVYRQEIQRGMVTKYYVVPIRRGRFSPKSLQKRPHSSLGRVSLGIQFPIYVLPYLLRVLYAISCCFGPRYNGTQLYMMYINIGELCYVLKIRFGLWFYTTQPPDNVMKWQESRMQHKTYFIQLSAFFMSAKIIKYRFSIFPVIFKWQCTCIALFHLAYHYIHNQICLHFLRYLKWFRWICQNTNEGVW